MSSVPIAAGIETVAAADEKTARSLTSEDLKATLKRQTPLGAEDAAEA